MPLDIARIGGFCFDVDGTLSDTDDHMVSRVARRLVPLQRLFTGTDLNKVARRMVMTLENPANFLVGLPDRFGVDNYFIGAIDFINRLGLGRTHERFWLVPLVAEMLGRLGEKYPLTVVSARDERSTRVFLEQHHLDRYFKAVATARTARHTKPYPDPIIWAAEQMGISPKECVMVGDTTVDIRAGKAAGAQTVGVLCGFGEERELVRFGADMILSTTGLLAEHILGPEKAEGLKP
jgi:phosphoglycolate phosphatase-like HAD superfamily hydrolase